MADYLFDLQSLRPELYEKIQLPAMEIPVRYEGALLCKVSVNGSGRIELDLPNDLIRRISSELAHLVVMSEPLPLGTGEQSGRTERLKSIEIYEAI